MKTHDSHLLDRHGFLVNAGAGLAAVALGSAAITRTQAAAAMSPGGRNLDALLAGNERFASGKPRCIPATAKRAELADGQAPFVAVLGCSDSRVPVEAVFDHNPGDIFVVRVAGNFVDDNGLGSLEYAVAVLKSSLILVLGHSHCGAVKAAVQYVKDGTAAPGYIQDIVKEIAPAAKASKSRAGDWVENAVAENVRLNVKAVMGRSTILAEAVKKETLTIAGAVYDLHTGKVNILG